MITQSFRNVRNIGLSDVSVSRDTREASRTLDIETSQGRIVILLVCDSLHADNLKILDYEIKQIQERN